MSRVTLLALASMILAAGLCLATPITGTLNFTGDATVTPTAFNFDCDVTLSCPPNYGDIQVTGPAGQTGTFTAVANKGAFGEDISVLTAPVNTPVNVADFLIFPTLPNVVFDLTELLAGVGGPCPPSGAAVCTPTNPALINPHNPGGKAPTNFADTQTGSTAYFSIFANARNVTTGEITKYKGIFSAQFGTNTAGVLADLAKFGHVTTSFSATLTPIVVPEPGTWGMIGTGLLLVAGSVIRRRREP